MYKIRFMKSKEEKHENHVKSFQKKTNHLNEIINQILSPKAMFDQQRKLSLKNLIKPYKEYIIEHI